MATRSSTDTKQVPWSSGLEDYNTGLSTNTILYSYNDAFLGSMKYFGQRPNLMYETVIGSTLPAASIGTPQSVGALSNGDLVIGTDENIYRYTPNNTTAVPILGPADAANWNSATNAYKLPPVPYQSAGGGPEVVYMQTLTNQIIVYDPNTITTHTVGALPIKPNPFAVSLDGYMFVAAYEDDTIYNSNVNDPFTYNTGVNLIRATQYPGNIVALCRVSNYVVALKTGSIEYFYNAGLINTSPLQRNTSLTKRIGCSSPTTLAVNENIMFFVGKYNGVGDNKVFMVSDTGAKEISTPLVERRLKDNFILMEGAFYNVEAGSARIFGKLYYVLRRVGAIYPALVYDVEEGVWHEWEVSSLDAGVFPVGFGIVFPTTFIGSVGIGFYNNQNTYFIFDMGQAAFGSVSSNTALFRLNNNNSFTTKDYVKKDSDVLGQYVPISVTLKLPTSNYGSGDRKFLRKVAVASQTPLETEHSITFTKYAGYDRQTITMTTTNADNVSYHNLGSFVYGDIVYTWRDSTASTEPGKDARYVRFDGVELKITKGRS